MTLWWSLPCGAIGFINGINNQQTQSIASAQQLSQYAGGAKVYGIYNATNWDSIQWVSTVILKTMEVRNEIIF